MSPRDQEFEPGLPIFGQDADQVTANGDFEASADDSYVPIEDSRPIPGSAGPLAVSGNLNGYSDGETGLIDESEILPEERDEVKAARKAEQELKSSRVDTEDQEDVTDEDITSRDDLTIEEKIKALELRGVPTRKAVVRCLSIFPNYYFDKGEFKSAIAALANLMGKDGFKYAAISQAVYSLVNSGMIEQTKSESGKVIESLRLRDEPKNLLNRMQEARVR